MDTTIFYEKQRFNQWYIILFFIVIDGFSIYETMKMMPQQNSHFFGLVILAAVNVLLILLKMETTVKEDGIHLRFFPIIRHRFYGWDTIQKAEIIRYNPMLYGGWGIRYGAYSVSGNKALQLEFKNSSQLLIGTQQPQAMQTILNALQK